MSSSKLFLIILLGLFCLGLIGALYNYEPTNQNISLIETNIFMVKLPEQDFNCEVVYPLGRKVSSADSIRETIKSLLLGPTNNEKEAGYITSIPDGVKLNNFMVIDGLAYVDFSEALSGVAGSCLVSSIESQIKQTILQFEGINEVIISINGRTSEVLQP